jgi:hypothetical protein
MTEVITPFYRRSGSRKDAAPYARTLRWMRMHFVLAGTMLFLAALGLAGYLYGPLRRVDLGWTLRITRPGKIYQDSTQIQFVIALLLVSASLIEFRAVYYLSRRRAEGVLFARLAAGILVLGLPAGVLLWGMNPDVPGLPVGAVQQVLRVVALTVCCQAIMALWYEVRLFSRGMQYVLAVETVTTSPALQRLWRIGIALWGVIAVGLGLSLAVATDLIELPLPKPAPGQLLYATSFDAFNDEWDIYGGRDSARIAQADQLGLTGGNNRPVTGGVLVITYGSPYTSESVFSILDRKFNDMDLRVTTRMIAGPTDNQYGVIFRLHDLDNYYAFLISGDGYYSLVKKQDGVLVVISAWGLSNAIRQETTENEIRIVARGNQFTFFVNGQPLPLCLKGANLQSMWQEQNGVSTCFQGGELTYVYRDNDLKQGRIALSAGSSSDMERDIVVGFDDLVIVGPDPNQIPPVPEQ